MCICRPSLPIYPSSSLPPWKQYVCFLHLWLYCIYKFICTKCPILIWLISGLSEAINVSCVVFSVLFPLISVSVMFPSPLFLFALFSQVSDNLWCLRMLRAGGSKMAGHLSVRARLPRDQAVPLGRLQRQSLCLSSWMETPVSHLKVAGFISPSLRATERKKVGGRVKGNLSLQWCVWLGSTISGSHDVMCWILPALVSQWAVSALHSILEEDVAQRQFTGRGLREGPLQAAASPCPSLREAAFSKGQEI